MGPSGCATAHTRSGQRPTADAAAAPAPPPTEGRPWRRRGVEAAGGAPGARLPRDANRLLRKGETAAMGAEALAAFRKVSADGGRSAFCAARQCSFTKRKV